MFVHSINSTTLVFHGVCRPPIKDPNEMALEVTSGGRVIEWLACYGRMRGWPVVAGCAFGNRSAKHQTSVSMDVSCNYWWLVRSCGCGNRVLLVYVLFRLCARSGCGSSSLFAFVINACLVQEANSRQFVHQFCSLKE